MHSFIFGTEKSGMVRLVTNSHCIWFYGEKRMVVGKWRKCGGISCLTWTARTRVVCTFLNRRFSNTSFFVVCWAFSIVQSLSIRKYSVEAKAGCLAVPSVFPSPFMMPSTFSTLHESVFARPYCTVVTTVRSYCSGSMIEVLPYAHAYSWILNHTKGVRDVSVLAISL